MTNQLEIEHEPSMDVRDVIPELKRKKTTNHSSKQHSIRLLDIGNWNEKKSIYSKKFAYK